MIKTLTILGFFLFTYSTQAFDIMKITYTPKYKQDYVKDTYGHNLELGWETTSWEYLEFEKDGSIFISDKGLMHGIRGKYQSILSDNFILSLGGRLILGNTTYEGGYSDGTPLTTKNINMITEFEGKIGKAFSVDSIGLVATPYLGYNLRYLRNPENPNVAGDYTRVQDYKSIPIGLETKLYVSRKTSIGLEYTHYEFQSGSIKSNLSEANETLKDINLKQQSGKGFRVMASLTTPINDKLVTFSPYYRYWEIADSEYSEVQEYEVGTQNKSSRFYEPRNTTKMIGININLAF